MISIIAHKTTMEIPILNTLYGYKKKSYLKNYSGDIDINKLNNLSLRKVNKLKFRSMYLLNHLTEEDFCLKLP